MKGSPAVAPASDDDRSDADLPAAGEKPSDDPVDSSRLHSVQPTFEALYAAEYKRIFKHALWITGNRSEAEDLTQDAFNAALAKWATVAALDWPAGWLMRVVTNREVSLRRRWDVEARFRRGQPAPEQAGIDEQSVHLWMLVRALPRRQAQAIALKYGVGLTVDEVAEVLGCAPETVKTHLTRARAALARLLDEGVDDAHEH